MKEKKYYDINPLDIPFIEYNNIYVGNLSWISRGVDSSIATYDLVVREKPAEWGYYIFDGLERFVDYLLNFKFDEDALLVLRKLGLINSPETEKFYSEFKFSGDVFALKEGTLFFPGEPIVRITAPLAEANIITALILNSFSYPVRVVTKASRMMTASQDKMLIAGSAVRLPGFEQGIWMVRGSYVVGSAFSNFTPQSFRKFPELLERPITLSANINHAFIKSFSIEEDAFRYVFDVLEPQFNLMLVMIDTYDIKKGLEKFIEEAKKSKDFVSKKFMITIDSGDLLQESQHVRQRLDEEGMSDLKIQVFSNLDEYKIKDLLDRGAPIDCFIASTEIANITDNPKFEAVYKMAQLQHTDGTIEYKAKFAEGKTSLPGVKQIFRVYNNGAMVKDIIGLEGEILGEPLLKQYVKKGVLTQAFETLDEVKGKVKEELESLSDEFKLVHCVSTYPVEVSDKLKNLLEEVKIKHN